MASESPSAVRKVVIHLRCSYSKATKIQVEGEKGYYTLASDVSGTDKFASVIDILRDTLFVYINSAFSPIPDESVMDLYNNFGIDGKLLVNYACSMAWG